MFVIVRHGNTFSGGETSRRIGARTDLPLTDVGRQQARDLAEHFAAAGWRFTRALVSPLRRTRETAGLILASQPDAPQVEICDWLCEIDHGPDENQPEDAVLARIGAAALAAWDERAEAPPGWIVDAEGRRAAWRNLFAGGTSGATLVVTSNGAARFALSATATLARAAAALPGLKLPTGAYGIIREGDGGALEVPVWGARP